MYIHLYAYTCTHTYIYIFIFVSIIHYCKILNIVPYGGSYFLRAFYSEKNILYILISATILVFLLPIQFSFSSHKAVLINHLPVLLQRILFKDTIINIGKCTTLRVCDLVESKEQQGVSGFNLSFEK